MKKVKKIPAIVVKALLQLVDYSDARLEYGGYFGLGPNKDEYVDSIKIILKSKQEPDSRGRIESYIELPDEIAVFHTHPRDRIPISGRDLVTAIKRNPAFVNLQGKCGKTEVNIIVTRRGVWIFKVAKRLIKKLLAAIAEREGLTIRSPEMHHGLDTNIIQRTDEWAEKVMLGKMSLSEFEKRVRDLGFVTKFIPIDDLDEIDISDFLIGNELDDVNEACITIRKNAILPPKFQKS